MMNTALIASKLESARAYLERADRFPLTDHQVGSLIIAVGTLADIVEHLAAQQDALSARINDLASYHN